MRRPFSHVTKLAENWHSFADDTIMTMCYNCIVHKCIQNFDKLYYRLFNSVL